MKCVCVFQKTRQIQKNDKMCFIESMLHRLLYFISTFRTICEYHTSKNLPLLLRPFNKFFLHLHTNQSAAQQVRNPSMQTSGNRKEPNLVNEPLVEELLSWIIATCDEPVLLYAMEQSWRKMTLCCLFQFGLFLPLFQAGNGSNRSIVVDNVQY